LFFVVRGIEWELTFRGGSSAIGMAAIPDQGLHGRHERARNHQKVAVEHADQVEERVESRHDLAGLDCGYVHLRQAQAMPEFELTPTAFVPLLNQFTTDGVRQGISPMLDFGEASRLYSI
jgi:hypothetical protein